MEARPAPRPLRTLRDEDLKRAAKGVYGRIDEVALTDSAAALAYYGFLSLFPALLVAIALLALLGNYPETYRSIIDTLREAAPGSAVDTIDGALSNVLRSGGASSLLGIGLLFSFLASSGAVGASIRALERINGTREGTGFVKALVRSSLTRLWLTLALMALFLIAVAALLFAGPIFGAVSEAAGIGEAGRRAVALSRYPAGIAALGGALLLLYTRGPADSGRRLVDHLPGTVLAILLWVLASVAFSFYVDNFGSYDKTYGTLGAVIVLLIWIYVGAMAMLIGALVNRELLRVREPG